MRIFFGKCDGFWFVGDLEIVTTFLWLSLSACFVLIFKLSFGILIIGVVSHVRLINILSSLLKILHETPFKFELKLSLLCQNVLHDFFIKPHRTETFISIIKCILKIPFPLSSSEIHKTKVIPIFHIHISFITRKKYTFNMLILKLKMYYRIAIA